MEFMSSDYIHSKGEIALITSSAVVVNFIHVTDEGRVAITPINLSPEDIITEMTILDQRKSFPIELGRIIFWRKLINEVDGEELTSEDYYFTTPLMK